MKILGIETSCDDTAVALVERRNDFFVVEKINIASQIDIHEKYGGIVPEIAGRRHADVIIPVLRETLCGNHKDNGKDGKRPDVIAVTAGPGLITSLVVGVEVAKGLSYGWGVPIVRVNHIEGHIYSALLRERSSHAAGPPIVSADIGIASEIQFPALALIVSGGHTELILLRGFPAGKEDNSAYELLGKTRDDAVGECFDKVGKLLDFEYPGGPRIAQLAREGRRDAVSLPRPMIDSGDFAFSFAGLKTAARYYLRDNPPEGPAVADFCASFEQAIVDVLVLKTMRAAQKYQAQTIILGGGVSANQHLRDTLLQTAQRELPSVNVLIPELGYTTDNAAMIAAAGYYHAIKNDFTSWRDLAADPVWELA